MGKFILLLWITISFTSYNCCIYGYYEENRDIEGIKDAIQEEYKKINTELSLITKKNELMELSTEGGELVYSYDTTMHLKKVVKTLYGEMGKFIVEYYYKNQNLVFCLSQLTSYSMPFYIEAFEEAKIETNIYYFHDQSLIKWTYREENPKLYIDKITTLDKDPNTPEAQKIANDLLIEAQEFLKEKLEQKEEW